MTWVHPIKLEIPVWKYVQLSVQDGSPTVVWTSVCLISSSDTGELMDGEREGWNHQSHGALKQNCILATRESHDMHLIGAISKLT